MSPENKTKLVGTKSSKHRFWIMDNIVAGKEYGVLGCNAYTPPAESKTPYGSWSKVN